MNQLQTFTDKAAISFSILCTAHCLLLPLAVVLLPSINALQLNNESFHFWMILVVLPTSVYALTMGCRKHNKLSLPLLGLAGLTCLVAAIVLEETLLHGSQYSEIAEKGLTLLGAAILVYTHLNNYRLCQKHECADCSSKQNLDKQDAGLGKAH